MAFVALQSKLRKLGASLTRPIYLSFVILLFLWRSSPKLITSLACIITSRSYQSINSVALQNKHMTMKIIGLLTSLHEDFTQLMLQNMLESIHGRNLPTGVVWKLRFRPS